ncbi:MAG TPA: hypothetical protein VI362_04415 [Ignavibacteriaceae bacterium]|nr:hypothetical protein [Ignavibacteriaceae bacterium]
MNLALLLLFIFFLNVSFGYWRGNVNKLSLQWFLAIHLPVLFIIAFRWFSGIGIELNSFLFSITVFFTGQILGNKIFILRRKSGSTPLTSCLVMDLLRIKKSTD